MAIPDLYNQPGASIRSIADRLHISRYAVVKALRLAGIFPTSSLPRKAIADAYMLSDRSLTQVAKDYGIAVSTVYEIVLEHYGTAGKQKTIAANKRRSHCVNYYDCDLD